MKLLIVDDSTIMQKTIERTLDKYELDIVGTAGNGNDAIEMVKTHKPDLITLDITMPEMDGITCLENIMSIHPAAKVVMVTAISDKLTGLKALSKGARGFIFKPVDTAKLTATFEKLINSN